MRNGPDDSHAAIGVQFVVNRYLRGLLFILVICQAGYSQQAASNIQQVPPGSTARPSDAKGRIAGNAFPQPNEMRSEGGVLDSQESQKSAGHCSLDDVLAVFDSCSYPVHRFAQTSFLVQQPCLLCFSIAEIPIVLDSMKAQGLLEIVVD